jgi:hypothetical protein
MGIRPAELTQATINRFLFDWKNWKRLADVECSVDTPTGSVETPTAKILARSSFAPTFFCDSSTLYGGNRPL